MLTLQEIRHLTDKDLRIELATASRELMRISMDLEGSQTKEIHKKQQLRRHIARLKTIDKENQKEDALKEKQSEAKEVKEVEDKTTEDQPKKT